MKHDEDLFPLKIKIILLTYYSRTLTFLYILPNLALYWGFLKNLAAKIDCLNEN